MFAANDTGLFFFLEEPHFCSVTDVGKGGGSVGVVLKTAWSCSRYSLTEYAIFACVHVLLAFPIDKNRAGQQALSCTV